MAIGFALEELLLSARFPNLHSGSLGQWRSGHLAWGAETASSNVRYFDSLISD